MILGLLACTQTVHFPESRYPTVDSGLDTGQVVVPPPPTPDEPATIERSTIEAGCNAAQTGFLASFRTQGSSGSASALLVGATRFERHPFDLEASAADGSWDRYALGPLLIDTDAVPGATTGFSCDDEASVSWVLWTSDPVGVPTDCVHWGSDPSGAIAALTHEAPAAAALCVDLGASP